MRRSLLLLGVLWATPVSGQSCEAIENSLQSGHSVLVTESNGCILSGNYHYEGSGTFLHLQGIQRFTIRDARFSRSTPGPLILVSGAVHDAMFITIENSTLDGGRLDLERALSVVVSHSIFTNADWGIVARGGVNGLTVDRQTTFYGLQNGAMAALGMNQAWTVDGCIFENTTAGRAGGFVHGADSFIFGFNWRGNWHGDVSQPGQPWIDNLHAGGISITGNYFGTAGNYTPLIRLSLSQGGSIDGNRFEGETAVQFAPYGSWNLSMNGNDFMTRTQTSGNASGLRVNGDPRE